MKTLFKGRTTLGGIQTHDTRLSRWDLYQLGYQGNSAANLQHNTKANIKPLCYGTVYFSLVTDPLLYVMAVKGGVRGRKGSGDKTYPTLILECELF